MRSRNVVMSAAGAETPVYVEEVFSTYLYSGTGSTQTITNNIDLSTKGGLVWTKFRSGSFGTETHALIDTVRGAPKYISSDGTGAEVSNAGFTSFSTTGYVLGSYGTGASAGTYASWTFRKQPKFFDIVTWTGTGSARTIAHNLGATPGMIIVKRTDTTGNWQVYHNGLTSAANSIQLNLIAAQASATTVWNSTAPTSSVFSVGTDATVNASGGTYVAYIYTASNSGGFGPAGTDSVVACGSATMDSNNSGSATINLGWEPQFVLLKRTDAASQWAIFDTMRGWAYTNTAYLQPNNSNAEGNYGAAFVGAPTATGFTMQQFGVGTSWIYMAIRRGPMKVPTSGTSVFKPVTRAGTSAVDSITGVGFTPDTMLTKNRAGSTDSEDWCFNFFDRLRSPGRRLSTAFTAAEDTSLTFLTSMDMDGVTLPSTGWTATNGSGYNYINYFFRRAPGFFDEVCYTGTGVTRTVEHNLGVTPELMIVKSRSSNTDWKVYAQPLGNTLRLELSATSGAGSQGEWASTSPTSSVFTVAQQIGVNNSGLTYVAYLFATCPGVSKVGSYTGTGTTNQINCGFTNGARFVLIKRTDSTGDWYTWDSARGIIAGNDPYLLMNSTAIEVTNTDYIDPYSPGFELSSTAPAALNANGGTYIFLAIA